MQIQYAPIGTFQSCFREKFGVPRQSFLADAAWGVLKLNDEPRFRSALFQLETFSHIWILFDFHKNGGTWHPTIDTPRIGNKEVGVFATRSPHRPNSIGLSAAKLERLDYEAIGGIELHVSGMDILDGTPVLDIKPYLPYADRIEDAQSGWASEEIERHPVSFSAASLETIRAASYPKLQALLQQMLELDPRPTSQRRATPIQESSSDGAHFAFRVLDYDIHWEIRQKSLHVTSVISLV